MKRLSVAILILLTMSACSPAEEGVQELMEIPKGYALIVRLYDEDSGYTSVYSDGYNVIDHKGKKRSEYSKDAKAAIALSLTAKPAKEFKTFEGSDVIDPLTVGGLEVSPYIPYNYKADLASSATYIATCKANGYTLVSLKQDSVSADIELVKNQTKLRVIIYDSILKIYATGLENTSWR